MNACQTSTENKQFNYPPTLSTVSLEAKLFRDQRNLDESFNIVNAILENSKCNNSKKSAIIQAGEKITWEELGEHVHKAQNILLELKINPGDRVALVANDSILMATTLLSLMYRGCIVILINPLSNEKQIAQQIDISRVSSAFVPKEMKYLVVENSVEFFELETMRNSSISFDRQTHNFDHSPSTAPFSLAFGVFTSGSTGSPKLALHRHQDFIVALTRYAHQVLDLQQTDTVFCVSRLSFAFGLQNMFITLLQGATYILSPPIISTEHVFKSLLVHKPTVMLAVPRVYELLLNSDECSSSLVTSLRLCASAGEMLPRAIASQWETDYKIRILDSIGSTEVLSTYISNVPNSDRSGSTGKLLPGFEAKLINKSGNPCQLDEAGVLWIRGASIISNYDSDDVGKELFKDGWFCSNDVFRQDRDGYFYFIGRNNEMMKINGLWVSPIEIEDTLKTLCDVADVAIIPLEKGTGTTKIQAFVVPTDDTRRPKIKHLKQYCKQHLGDWKYPHSVNFVDQLPKTVTGKLARFKLKESSKQLIQ